MIEIRGIPNEPMVKDFYIVILIQFVFLIWPGVSTHFNICNCVIGYDAFGQIPFNFNIQNQQKSSCVVSPIYLAFFFLASEWYLKDSSIKSSPT